MANVITGKVWTLDSVAGIVTTSPVTIDCIRVTWTTASAGNLVLATANSADIILQAATVTAATLAWAPMTQEFSMGNQTFLGLTKVTVTGLAATAIQIVTGVPR